MNEFEVLRIIKLLERTHAAFDEIMPFRDDQPLWNIAAYLMRSEYSKQVVTITSLCSVTGLPYATSRRLITSLIGKGLITRSVRGCSGKSYSLHASDRLKESFDRYAREIKSILAETVAARPGSGSIEECYFGAPGSAFPSPPVGLARMREAGQELKFLMNKDNYFSALRNMWTDFRRNLGSSSSFKLLPCPEMREELIANARRETSCYDIVSVNLPWLGEFVENGVLRPIGDLIEDFDAPPSLMASDLNSVCQWNGKMYGVPVYCSVNLFAARADLFADANMKFPSTFDDVIAAGRELSDSSSGTYGIVWDAAPGVPIATTFMTLLAASNGPLMVTRPASALMRKMVGEFQLADIVTGEAGYRTLAFMHELVAISPPDILHTAWDDSLEIFLSGKAAMAYCWSMRAARFEYDVRSIVKRRVKYLPQPAPPGGSHAAPLSGFMLAVPANLPEERAKLAVGAIKWLIADERVNAQAGSGLPIAPRFAFTADPEMKASSPIIRLIEELIRKGLLHTQHQPISPQFAQIEAILGEEVHSALAREKSDTAALSTAAQRIDRITRRRPGDTATAAPAPRLPITVGDYS